MSDQLAIDVTPSKPDPSLPNPALMGPAPEGKALAMRLPGEIDPESLIAKAIEHNVPVDTLERLLALRDKLKAESARAAFFSALAAFQAECPIIPKSKQTSGSTGTYSYKYAPLDVIVGHTQPIMQRHGLSTTFDTAIEGAETARESLVVTCRVHHLAGHSEASVFRVPIDKAARMNDTQKVGSANTYAKRYAYCNALGILTGDEDDDGKGGTGKEPVEFGDPPRKAAPPASDAAPTDCLSENKVKAVRSKIHAQLKACGRDDAATMTLVEARLDELAAHDGRSKWQHASWRDFQSVLDAVESVVATLPPREHARRVRR